LPLYKKIAARKLMLFHGHNNSVRIRELLSSQTLGELSDLKIPGQTEEQLLGSWFSLQSTMRVHNTFLRLDEYCNGSLSLSEFSQISGSTMSMLFLKRIFEEHVGMKKGPQTSRDRMDLTEFTDFVLAWDHRSNPAAIKYFFPIFDLKKQGFITPHELYIFFKEVHIMWVQVLGEYADLSVFDVIDELIGEVISINRVFHELGHATGHERRLNRPAVTGDIQFGSGTYSKEELVAELTSSFCAATVSLDHTLTENAASYIQGWLSVLKADPKAVVITAAQAQRAADLIRGVTYES
jgi:Ca2+-binding EF-hand superfamily protein